MRRSTTRNHGRLGLIVLAILSLENAPAQPAQKFQPLPKDESLQPLPPNNKGLVQFVGNHAFTEEQLRQPLAEQIGDIQKQGLTKPRADDTSYYLAAYYRNQGYVDADVRWDIRGSRLILTIKEGPRLFLRKVSFQGNHAFDDKTLFEYLVGGTQERLAKAPAEFPFVLGNIQTGVDRVRGFYQSEGYLDALIDDAIITYSADHTHADVLVKIGEGARYTFGAVLIGNSVVLPPNEIKFAGTPVFSREELISVLGEPLSNPFTTQRVNSMQRDLQFYYKQHGYYAAEVEAAADPKNAVPIKNNERRVPVTFTVKPGAIYHFDGTTVTGLTRLHPTVVENRFESLSGKVYKPEAMDEKFRELLQTGLFTNLRINTTPLPDNTVRMDLTAEEAKPKEIGFSVGYSTYEGEILGLHLANRDLFGSGRPLSLDVDYSQREVRSEFLYVNPWLFESDVSLRARLFVEERDETGYSKRDTGLRLEFARKLNKNVEFGAFIQFKSVEITDSPITLSFLGPTAYQIGTVGLTQNFDYRNSKVDPGKGWIVTTAEDIDTIAGQAAFGRVTARITEYIPIHEKLLLALGARGGLIFPFTQIPIDERYFNGGATSVRSFLERELGPRDPHNYPVGGEAFTVFNAELDFPIKGALIGAVFADAGNVVAEEKNAGLQDMRFAFGVGLRYKLPIGPLRLDVGMNPNPRDDERWGAVNFSFGFAF